jgi:hypothetical protein
MVEAEVSDHSPSSSEPPRLEAGVLASRWCLAAFFRSSFDMCVQKRLLCELVALENKFYRLEKKKKKREKRTDQLHVIYVNSKAGFGVPTAYIPANWSCLQEGGVPMDLFYFIYKIDNS